MPFSINEALATFNAVGGLTKASKFFVTITPPAGLLDGTVSDLSFLCENAVLPGVALASDEIRMAGYGLVEKRAYAVGFTDVALTFFNDSEGRVLKFFHSWIQSIYNFDARAAGGSVAYGLTLDTLAYPNDYYGTVNIMHFNDKGGQGEEDAIINYQLIEAYPIAVGDVQVDWNLSDTLVRVPVVFAYKSWTADTLDQGAMDAAAEANAQGLSSRETRNNIGTIRELLSVTSPALVERIADRLVSVGGGGF